jgi:single-stranded DNA-binding protein
VVWGTLAKPCRRYVVEGQQLYIKGAIGSRLSDDIDGETRSVMEIIARPVQCLGSGSGKTDDEEVEGFDDGGTGRLPDEDRAS